MEDISRFIFKVYICLLLVGRISYCYNIDTKSSVIFQGPKGSYFGYSVGILENRDGVLVLVGAPRDDTATRTNITRPGQLYKCHYNNHDNRCQRVIVNDEGNIEKTITYHGKQVTFHNDMTDQWLGMTLDVEPVNHSSVVVCAPRWKDLYIERKMNGTSHMTGMCYILDSKLTSPPRMLPALTNLKRLVNGKNHYVEFSMGAMGFSAAYANINDTILFGAPGLNDWSGGVVIETVTGESNIKYLEPSRHDYQDSYSGYSITTGRFINRDQYSIAVGAPRADNVGKVLLYSSTSTKGPQLTVDGEQTGSYFGASLCSLSTNNDLLDNLVVGAPMYSDKSPEEGRVFIFRSHGLLGFKLATVLSGSQRPYSRFGTAIVNIGDLNKDSYEDIIVSAPYEDDGRGTVYIYNGYHSGIWHKFTQRIQATGIDPGLRTFGISFSRPYDVDKNGYSDIAVGAYSSSSTVLLHSQPVIDMSELAMNVIDLHHVSGCIVKGRQRDNCTDHNLFQGTIVFCMFYKGQSSNSPNSVVVTYDIVFDSTRNISRIFHSYNEQFLNRKTLNGKRKLNINEKTCENNTFYVQFTDETNEDAWIRFDYKIQSRKVKVQEFDGRKTPPEITNMRMVKIELKPECTDADLCKNNLKLNASLKVNGENNSVYMLGRSENVLVDLVIQNVKTTKDVTVVVGYPNLLSFIKGGNSDNNRLPCTVEDEFSNTDVYVNCRLSKDAPLDNQENMSARLEFHLNTNKRNNIKLNVSAFSTQRISNNVTLELLVAEEANVSVLGKAKPDEIIFKHQNRTEAFNQKIAFSYIIYNSGPSLLKTGSILISYPEIPGINNMNALEIKSSPNDLSKYYCNIESKGHFTGELGRDIDENTDIQLICDGGHSYCTNIVCRFENINARGLIIMTMNLMLTLPGNRFQQLRHARLASTSFFRNTTDDKHWNEILLFGNFNKKRTIMLDIYKLDMNFEVREFQIWIIVISAAGGIAVFLVISLFMFKVGFFRRLENEDLQLRIANRKLQVADAHRYQNGNVHTQGSNHIHHINNNSFTEDLDDDETHVLIPFPNGSTSCSLDCEISSISSDESGYLEPVKTRKQRVFLK